MKAARKWLALILCMALLFVPVLPSGAEVTPQAQEQATQEPTATPSPVPEPTIAPTEEPTPEPTEEPTIEPTEEPTPQPTEEPTIEPTEEPTPEPTQEPTTQPTQEPTTQPAEEPTFAPTATPEPAQGSSFDTAILLKAGEEAEGEITAEIPEVYYRLTVEQNGNYQFLSDDDLPIMAVLTEGKSRVIGTFEPNLEEEENQEPKHFCYDVSLEKDTDYYLVITSDEEDKTGNFTILFDEQEEPADEPVTEPTAAPTQEPADKPTAAPDGKEPVAPHAKPQGNLVSTSSAPSDFRPSVINKVNGYPESAHPYANNTDMAWQYEVDGATEYEITFSSDTYVEYGYDFIYFLDEEENMITFTAEDGDEFNAFTGDQLANTIVTLSNYPSFSIGLYSDASNTFYGFRVTDIKVLSSTTPTPTPKPAAPSFTSGDQYGTNSARLAWTSIAGVTGYELYRSTSATGTFTKVQSVGSTSATDSGLTAGSVYYYVVKSYKDSNGSRYYSDPSAVKSVSILSKPSFNKAAASATTKAVFTWPAVTGASGYTLYVSSSENGTYTAVKTITGTSLEITGLKAGTLYFYKLAAYKTVGSQKVYGVTSDVAAVLTITSPAIKTGDLTAAASSKFTWSKISGVSGYSLWRCTTAAGRYQEVGRTTGTSLEDKSMAAGQKYYYVLRAYKTISGVRRYGAYSAAKTVQALGKAIIKTAECRSTTKAYLQWDAIPTATGYTVYRATSATGTYSAVKTLTTTSVEITGQSAGKAYFFKVAAYRTVAGKKINAPLSDIKPVLMLATPAIKTLVMSGATSATLTWGSVSGASGYAVSRSTSASGTYAVVKTLTGTSFSDSSLTPGSTYYYKVQAYKTISSVKYYTAYSTVKSIKISGSPLPNYRALLIGQSEYQVSPDLHGEQDATSMSNMLSRLNMNGRTYQITKRNSQTKSQIMSAISSAFSGATANDVSMFYYSGHGVVSSDSYAGALCGVDDNSLSCLIKASELRSALDQIPGTIIVILDSCGSGSVIYEKSAKGTVLVEQTRKEAVQFNQAFISAFSSGTVAKTGELRASKYQVLTACEYGDTSVESSQNGQYFGLFTLGLCRAGGWYIVNSTSIGMLGDSNNDSIVTLNEAYSYIRYYLDVDGVHQVVQVYPSGSTFPLFKR